MKTTDPWDGDLPVNTPNLDSDPWDEDLLPADPDPTAGSGETGSAPAAPPRGLRCPACGCGHFTVVKTIAGALGFIRRRRQCRNCGRRITTSERVIS